MTWWHRRQKKDGTHVAIARALEYHGCLVADLSQAGSGVPDLLCGYRGVLFCVEVKTPTGSLSKVQRAWFDEWAEYPALVLRSVDDVTHVMEELRDAYDLAAIDWQVLVPRGRRRPQRSVDDGAGVRGRPGRRVRGAGPGGADDDGARAGRGRRRVAGDRGGVAE